MRPDAEIAATVANMLKWHVPVEEGKIRINVKNGIVTLDGVVDRDFQRQAVEDTIRCLPGVIRLDNFVDVKPASRVALGEPQPLEALI